MAKINPERVAARLDGDFVVFLIGMRINAWWKPHKWFPVMMAMPRMIKELNERVGKSRGDVGIWHETYLVRDGQYEAVYSGMPPTGLGAAGEIVSASGNRDSARGRLEGGGG